MIRFSFSLSSLVFLLLVSFPSLASAQSTLTDAQIAKKFYPVKCQIIKRRVDISSPVNGTGQKYDKFTVSGASGMVMFAEFPNVSGGTRTADKLSSQIHIKRNGQDIVATGWRTVPLVTSSSSSTSTIGFLQRFSWQFSENHSDVDLSVTPPTIPIDYEVMIVWASPSPILSKSQVEKFAFSDISSFIEDNISYSKKMNLMDFSYLFKYLKDINFVLEDYPIYRIDIKSMCDQVKGK
jgi:hypothetical protein